MPMASRARPTVITYFGPKRRLNWPPMAPGDEGHRPGRQQPCPGLDRREVEAGLEEDRQHEEGTELAERSTRVLISP